MHSHVPASTPARTFAALAVVLAAAGLTPLAGPPRSGQPRSHPASAGPARPGPVAVFPMAGGRPGRGTITLRMGAGGRFVSRTPSAPPQRPPAASALPMHTLTVRATNLADQPDTGDGVLLLNVDNTALVDPVAAQQTFDHGTAKFSVPAGHYFAIGSFGPVRLLGVPGVPSRFIVLPQFTVTGNRTVTMHAAAAVKVTMATPRPATALDTAVWLLRTGTVGPPLVLELYQFGHAVWINPTRTRPAVGGLRASVSQHLESPPGRAVPYQYTLSYTDPPGIIPVPRFVARAKDLATVHERFYQAVPSSGGWAFGGSFPATDPNLNPSWFGFVEPTGPSLAFPGRLIEYAGGTGAARMEWSGQYSPSARLPWQSGGRRLLRPGQRLTENWSAYPLHPAANVLLEHEPNMFGAVLPSALRAGNTLRLSVDPFGDNQPGHQIGALFAVKGVRVTGSYQIDQDGRKIAGGNAVTQVGPGGEFYTQATLSGRPSTVRFALRLARASKFFPLSTAKQVANQNSLLGAAHCTEPQHQRGLGADFTSSAVLLINSRLKLSDYDSMEASSIFLRRLRGRMSVHTSLM